MPDVCPSRLTDVKIPNGDLAPARRRRYGGSYGRRRHRRNMRLGLGLGLLLVVVGSAYLLRHDDAMVPTRIAATPHCASPSPIPTAAAPARQVALPRPQQVRLVLLNGTARNNLAKTVGNALAARGFVVTAQGNAPAALAGPSQVVWGPGAQPSAALVAQQVIGARAVNSPRAPRGSVQLVLGSEFHRLATPAEAAAAGRTSPSASLAPTPTASACAA